MKKVFAILLALTMLLAMAVPAMAAGTGSITITNATIGKEYAIYKVFDATTNGTNTAYTYTKTGESDALYNALKSSDSPFTLEETSTSGVYNVSAKADTDVTDIADWLTAKKSYLTPAKTPITADTNTVEFTGLDYGYYYVTSTLGSAVSITNVAPSAEIQDKNQTGPTPTEDGLKNIVGPNGLLQEVNSASIGETVNFQIQFNATNYVGETAKTVYVVTDTLGKGFTLNENSLVVKVQGQTQNAAVELTKDTDYTVTKTTDTDNATVSTITIPWQDANGSFKYDAQTVVTITYSATVNENANPEDLTTLQNTANVDEEIEGTTTTKTYYFDLVKTDSSKKVINGAKFRLYTDGDDSTEIPVVADGNGYRVAKSGETGVDIEAGEARITGLAAGTYWLQETEAPAGYNKLTTRVEVKITDANRKAVVIDKTEMHDDEAVFIGREWKEGGIQVINNAGSELPATGGIGTTIFYVVGGLLMAAAVVLLVTKKKVASGK